MNYSTTLAILVVLLLTGCQINLFNRPISPIVSPNGRATGKFQVDGWQIDTVLRGPNYKSYLAHFVNEQVGYLVSTNYVDIQKTTDGGRTWTTQPSPLQTGRAYPRDIEFIDDKTGFISYQDTEGCPNGCRTRYSLLTTTNGGSTWTVVQAPEQGVLLSMHFTSATEGVATATEGASFTILSPILLRTTNGGKSWQKIPDILPAAYTYSLYFLDAQMGFIRNERQLFRTTDGGRTWALVTTALPTNVTYQPFQFITNQTGYVTSYDGFSQTTDGGKTWLNLWTGSTDLVGFVTPSEGFSIRTVKYYPNDIPDSDRELRHTLNGGKTWKAYPLVHNLSVASVQFVSERVGYAVQNNMVLRWIRR